MVRRGAWCLLGLVAAGGCQAKSAKGPNGAQIDIVTVAGAQLPTSIELVWLDATKVLRVWRVPEAGTLAPDQAGAVSVFIDVDPATAGSRRVIARGYNGGTRISEGAERLAIKRDTWTVVKVMLEAGALPDKDADGIPDRIDDCAGSSDPCIDVDAAADSARDRAPGPDAVATPDASPVDRPRDVITRDMWPDVNCEPPASVTNGTGTGLKGEYYADRMFSPAMLKLTRRDNVVDFYWAGGAPAPPPTFTNADVFSVRWTGQVEPRYTDTYTFYANCDDGVSLSVNNTSLFNMNLSQGMLRERKGAIFLVAGTMYDIKLEYVEYSGTAECHLFWSSSCFQNMELIPQSQLYPAFPDGGM